ncbi:hypothetical protein BJ322DRAFT_1086617 [Thelephora terrestris]|uniref:Uncharacterized protein n=1 Tax=Thelephora terrestris TaxID=56493 RepID=A0A9P6H5C3_9AGAM|nr:hypothetical protein BJ322DRAFT_1086617 [Thelephora terrestris]
MQSLRPYGTDEACLRRWDESDGKWAWSDVDRGTWKIASDRYQLFYRQWLAQPPNPKFSKTAPYELSIGADKHGTPLLPFHAADSSQGKILVTESYEYTFIRILYLRERDLGRARGVVLTGQPGTGKTTFLKYMLVRLLSARQVVLLYEKSGIYLFYLGQVYFSAARNFGHLPEHRTKGFCPVWALIDADLEAQEPPIRAHSNIWPIQASPPDPIRWKVWVRQNHASILGMPKWNMEELVKGLRLCPEYNNFRHRLAESLSLVDGSPPIATGDENIDATLQLLRKERGEEEEEEDCGESSDGARSLATDQGVNTVGETDQSEAAADQVDAAFEILVQNATGEFGFAPRDVYRGVFQLPATRMEHKAYVDDFTCEQFRAFINGFSTDHPFCNLPPHVIEVYPRPPPIGTTDDSWAVDFKSFRIGKEMVMKMSDTVDEKLLLEMYHHCRRTPGL